jgi:hypothetical protein
MLLREVAVWRDPPGLRGPTDGDTKGEEIDISIDRVLQTVESQGSGVKVEMIEAKRDERGLTCRYGVWIDIDR